MNFRSNSQSSKQYIELAGDNQIKFFFDEQYYLVEKECKFVSIVRISAFNKQKNIYEGEFTDYDLNGKVILTGSYFDGKKHGTFKSFYPNGFLNWQGQYESGERAGTWNFYYPDGKPRNILEIKECKVYVMHSWDEKGKQTIKDGDGKFILDEYLSGFNELGYDGFRYSGKVKNGLQNEAWLIEYIFPKNKREHFRSELYSNGQILMPFELNQVVKFNQVPLSKVIPVEYYDNAEKLISKECTIDDNSGFTIYLQNKLNAVFDLVPLTKADLKPVEISLHVNEKGQSSGIKIEQQLPTEFYEILKVILEDIRYWIPSQTAGKIIEDTLQIKMKIYQDNNGKPTFSLPQIIRIREK
ncbi:MAG TPA: hypothetical protein VGD22_02610 [Sphingobacteriaceae bacterium]